MMRALMVACWVCGCLASEGAWEPPCPGPLALLDKMAADDRIEVSEGVRFVRVNGSAEGEGSGTGGRSAKDSILEKVKRFFTNYELHVKVADIFQKKQDMVDTIRRAVRSLNQLQEENEETSRGKGHSGLGGGKKGGNGILMMATMMGGTMAALGFGALAMLVMKALTVSSMALLLSAVLGLRRLLRRPDDDGFGRISYIPVHTEHRKKRSLRNLPYRAYAKAQKSS